MSSFDRYCKPAIAPDGSLTDEMIRKAASLFEKGKMIQTTDALNEAIIAAAMRKVRWWRFPKILVEAGNGWEIKRVRCCQAGLYFKESYRLIFILPDMKIGNLAQSRWRPYRGFPPFVEEQK